MELLKKIEDLVRQAGDIVLLAHNVEEKTTLKTSAADMVTAYDVKVENFLKEHLMALLPEAIFYGEEEKENSDPLRSWAFVVDPIDGTANFVKGLHQSCISVALAKNGEIRYGVVLDPYKNEMFTAKLGGGAYLNGKPIHVSETPLSQGIFGIGTAPYHPDLREKTLNLTRQLWDRSCDFRRLGAAALDLCNVACGRLDLFAEYVLCPWDFAAGMLMITEAGGRVSTLEGTPLDISRRCSCWASNAVNADVLSQLTI